MCGIDKALVEGKMREGNADEDEGDERPVMIDELRVCESWLNSALACVAFVVCGIL